MNETLLEGFATKVFGTKTWMDTNFHQTDIIRRLRRVVLVYFHDKDHGMTLNISLKHE